MEEFTEDLYSYFKQLVDEGDEQANELWIKVRDFIIKRRDFEASEQHDMTPDLTPEEYKKMHEGRT